MIGVNTKTKVIMKKTIFFLMSLCALTLSSCVKEQNVGISEGSYTYTFNGAAGQETKVSVADKTDEGWPIKWTGGDVIHVYKTSDFEELGSAKLAEADAGKTHGTFTMTSTVEHTGEVLIAHGSSLEYADGKISAVVPAEQENIRAGASTHIGKSGLAYSKAVMSGADVPVDFVLEHKSAYVRLVLKTTEFSEHMLTGATLWCKGAYLAGTLSADVTDGTVTAGGSDDYVKVSFREANVAEFGSESVLWFSTLPADLSGKDVYVIVHMTKGTATVTVPVKIPGGNLQGGAVNTITIKDLKTSSAPAWYQTVETRYIAAYGESWSYGPANTFIGYPGAEFKFDVKARGNFMKCTEPAAMKVLYACCHNASNKGNLLFGTTNAYNGSSYITHDLDATYTVSMTANNAGTYTGYSSKVLLLDKSGNVIWAFNIWGNKDAVVEHTLTNGVVLDRNIGSTCHDTDYYRAGSYYQWGRPFSIEWSTSFYTKSSIPAESLEMSAAHPEIAYHKADGTQNWYAGPEGDGLNDLWGNDQASATDWTKQTGVKSIYDPCPKGYMVASPAVLNEIKNSAEVETVGNYKWLKYKDVYVPFSGAKWTGGGNTTNSGNSHAALWSNSSYNSTGRSYGILYSTKWGNLYHYRAAAYAVRCMKDTENR